MAPGKHPGEEVTIEGAGRRCALGKRRCQTSDAPRTLTLLSQIAHLYTRNNNIEYLENMMEIASGISMFILI